VIDNYFNFNFFSCASCILYSMSVLFYDGKNLCIVEVLVIKAHNSDDYAVNSCWHIPV